MIYVVNPLRYTLKYNIRHHHVRDVIAAYTYTSPSARRLFYGIIEPRTNDHQNKITLRNLHHARSLGQTPDARPLLYRIDRFHRFLTSLGFFGASPQKSRGGKNTQFSSSCPPLYALFSERELYDNWETVDRGN